MRVGADAHGPGQYIFAGSLMHVCVVPPRISWSCTIVCDAVSDITELSGALAGGVCLGMNLE